MHCFMLLQFPKKYDLDNYDSVITIECNFVSQEKINIILSFKFAQKNFYNYVDADLSITCHVMKMVLCDT